MAAREDKPSARSQKSHCSVCTCWQHCNLPRRYNFSKLLRRIRYYIKPETNTIDTYPKSSISKGPPPPARVVADAPILMSKWERIYWCLWMGLRAIFGVYESLRLFCCLWTIYLTKLHTSTVFNHSLCTHKTKKLLIFTRPSHHLQ